MGYFRKTHSNAVGVAPDEDVAKVGGGAGGGKGLLSTVVCMVHSGGLGKQAHQSACGLCSTMFCLCRWCILVQAQTCQATVPLSLSSNCPSAAAFVKSAPPNSSEGNACTRSARPPLCRWAAA